MPEPQQPEADPPPPQPPPPMKSIRLLRRGLDLSKKAAIAGAAITSAPVVIPPLLLGLAFAFPFAIYFAGFAFTDQVMAALLLSPPPPDEEEETEAESGGLVRSDDDDEVMTTPLSPPNESEGVKKSEEEMSKQTEVEPNGNKGEVEKLRSMGGGNTEDGSRVPPLSMTGCDSGTTNIASESADLVHYDNEVMTAPFSPPNDYEEDEKTKDETETEPNENEGGVNTLGSMEAMGGGGKEEDASIAAPSYTTHAKSGTDLVGETTGLVHPDNKGLRGSVEEGAATEQWERADKGQVEVEGDGSDVVIAEHEIEMWPPTSALEVQREEVDNTEGMGFENQRLVEEATERKLENISSEQEININPTIASSIDDEDIIGDTDDKDLGRLVEEGLPMEQRVSAEKDQVEVEGDGSDVVTTEHEIEMWPPTTALEVLSEEEDHTERMGIEDQRCVEEVRERKLDNNDREQETKIKPKIASSVDDKKDIIGDEEMPVQVERGAEEIDKKEEMGKSTEKVEIEQEKLNEEEETESSEFESSANGVSSEAVGENPTKEGGVGEGKEANEETLIGQERREMGEGNADAEIGQPARVVETVAVVHSDNEGLRGSVEEGVPKQQSPRAKKEQEGVEGDGSDLVTAEHKIEMWSTTTTSEIKGDEGDNAQEMGMGDQRFMEEVRESKLDSSDKERDAKIRPNIAYSVDSKEDIIGNTGMLVEESDNKEEMGKSGEKVEIDKEKLNEEEVIGGSEYSSPIDVKMVEKIKAEQEEEVVQDAGVLPGTEKKRNETVVKEVMLEGRPEEEMEDKVQGEDLSAIEADEPLPSLYHSLASTPEKSEILEHISLSSNYESSTNGGNSGAVEEKPTKERGEGESKEANEEKVNVKGNMAPVQTVVEQSEVRVSGNEVAFETLVVIETLGKAEETEIGEVNAEVGGFDVDSLEHKSEMMPSSLSTEYASAVEDQSSEMTDADSGPAVIVVETVGVVHSDNEVFYSEEMKIWEEIHAMRTIVGYQDALHSSLVDELKALYLFTGVEPPASLKEVTDLVEVDNKLQFLKSVIGVE